jgi:signal transduction histidine kinase
VFVARIVFAPGAVKGSQPADMLTNTLILMGVGSIFILICLYILLNIFVLRPLEKLKIYCQKLLQRDYSTKLEYSGSYDEISKLYEMYEHMRKELEKYEIEREEINKRAENVLLSAHRLASSGMLLSEIAHEINNPLGGIINAVDVLKDGNLSEQKKKQYFELIADGLERMKKTVSRVLFMHRSGEPKGLIDIPTVINNAVMFADSKAKRKGIKIINEVEEELPKVLGNSTELQQTFLNILLNAVDACVIDEGVITITSSTDKNRVKIYVKDNGHGMSLQEIKLCKEPFFTTKEDFGGTGLGLVIANKIIQNHGGVLDIQSQVGVGTTITISLPKVG